MAAMRENLAIKALTDAIVAAGSSSALARCIGVSPQAVAQWKVVPAERVLSVETATGISRYELRPDVFGPAPEAAE